MNNLNFLAGPQFYIPFLIWIIFWKGFALWKAASNRQLIWFVLLLILNTGGLFEIAYIFFLNKWDLDNGKTLKYIEKKFKEIKK